MSKFKVWDKVKRIKGGTNNGFSIGDTGYVIEIVHDRTCPVNIKMDKNSELSTGNAEACLELISSNYKPKAPTHIVIWEEDRDPARLFTSEKDARDFIKELSDKPSVKKDSILLIEVKSCKKVKVDKILKYGLHKI